MLNYEIPIIEQLASGSLECLDKTTASQIAKRRELSSKVVKYYQALNGGKPTLDRQDNYYSAISTLLSQPDYQRLLLYLPLSDLKGAPNYFKEIYLEAWFRLLGVRDARENFLMGDTYEVKARPGGKIERVVKCAHLTPWLVEAGYIDFGDLRDILRSCQNEVLLRSFSNTWHILDDRQLFSKDKMSVLRGLTAHVTSRDIIKPLFVSEGRRKWLKNRFEKTSCSDLMTPDAKLAGPFSPNIYAYLDKLEGVQGLLGENEVALVGGSYLKGYSIRKSDFDIFPLNDLKRDSKMRAGSPHAAHIYYNMLWLGGKSVKNLSDVALANAKAYFGGTRRKMSIERIESDLLQYRLLHKGFQRFYGGCKSEAEGYPEIDGDCPFFDDSYRRIATELFVKYVFIPA